MPGPGGEVTGQGGENTLRVAALNAITYPAGTYLSIVDRNPFVGRDLGARIDITTTATGSFTAKLTGDGVASTLKGIMVPPLSGSTASAATGRADFIRKGGTGRRPKCESVYALHILPDGTVNLYSGSAWPDRITSPFVAIGSGCKYAMAVMWAGFDSARACEAAIALDKSCSAPVVTLQPSKQPHA